MASFDYNTDDEEAGEELMNTDTLYWWDEMDKHHLVVMFLGKLNQQCSSSAAVTPSATSWKNKSSTASNKKQKTDELQQTMADHVAGLNKSVATLTSSGIQGQINNYKQEVFKLQEKKFTTPNITQDYVALIDTRINDINGSINDPEEKLESLASQPGTLKYARNATN
eukprot:scaffold28153_cov22-Cyclotella_meneghiniana.AAC.2